jgi:hypothetical protein
VLGAIAAARLSSPVSVVASLFVNAEPVERLDFPPEELAALIERQISTGEDYQTIPTRAGRLIFQRIPEGSQIYIPQTGNIGFYVNFDQIPFTAETYFQAISLMAGKKSRTRSQWLLIWSLGFWKDKHWLENHVIAKLKEAFVDSPCEKIFFAESLPNEGAFQVNLSVHTIKE